MATITRKTSQHVSIPPRVVDDSSNHGQVHILSENIVPLADLQPGQRDVVVVAPGGLVLSERHSAHFAKFLYSLDLRELYKMWYKKKGWVIEKELVNAAKAKAASDTLQSKCSETRFQSILRRAFQEEEDDDDDALLAHCKAVLESNKDTVGTPDAFMGVHRVIYEANSGAHSLDVAALRQLASDGPRGAEELAEGIGRADVAPLVRAMAKDLLPVCNGAFLTTDDTNRGWEEAADWRAVPREAMQRRREAIQPTPT